MVDDRYRPWSAAVLQGCANVLGDTDTGLTGSKIGALLADLRIPDVYPQASKRDRLYAALANRQNSDGNSRRVVRCCRWTTGGWSGCCLSCDCPAGCVSRR